MMGCGSRKFIAQRRPTDIEREATLKQFISYPTGGGLLLMQDDKNRLFHKKCGS
jgi:hypothetical protein